MRKIKLTSEALKKAADCLRVISHPVRLHIIQLLIEKERSVGEIAEICDIPHNLASTHLKTLERCMLLGNKRTGTKVIYRIIERHLGDLLKCIEKRFAIEDNYERTK